MTDKGNSGHSVAGQSGEETGDDEWSATKSDRTEMTNGPNPQWAYRYYDKFSDKCLASPQREITIEKLINLDYGAVSTQALADLVEKGLQRHGHLAPNQEYTSNDLNQILPDLEPFNPVHRIPKFGRGTALRDNEGEYVIIPTTRMLSWLENTGLPDVMTPQDVPEGWGTHYTGQYITNRIDDALAEDADLNAGNPLPVEALVQATVHEYASVDQESLSVDVEMGSLERIRESGFKLDRIVSHLSVEDVLPAPNGDWRDKGNDYGIFTRVTGVTAFDSDRAKNAVRRNLEELVSFWLASALGIYDRTYSERQADRRIPQEELARQVDTIRQAGQQTGVLHEFDLDSEVFPAQQTQGQDQTQTYTIVCGVYRRSNKDNPQL